MAFRSDDIFVVLIPMEHEGSALERIWEESCTETRGERDE
jgi:hypothetical protein